MVDSCGDGKGPVGKRHRGMGKKRKTCFDNVTMTPFGVAIMLGFVRWRRELRDAKKKELDIPTQLSE